ncbi:MAG: AI-2E family transporter [Burkholderiaceae bacterium]|nr:AI-2E family transporter [Microbacteriaceae bacterium]
MLFKSRPAAPVEVPPVSLWTDSLGRAAIRSAQVLLLLIVIIAAVVAFIQLKLVIIPVLIALILASALSPLVAWLEKRMRRVFAAIISLLLGVIAFGGIITVAVLGVTSQFDTLQRSVTKGIDQIVEFVNTGPIPIDQGQITGIQNAVTDFLTSSQFGSGALAGVSAAIEVITGVVLGVFILFFFAKDGPQIWAFLIKPLSPRPHAKARRAGSRAVSTLGGYVRGTAIVAFVDAFFIGLALVILQVPLALPLALVVFIGAFIPIVGATASGVVAALVALVTVDVNAAIWVIVVVIAVNQLEGNFLSPFVLGSQIKLYALVVLLALTAGTILGGIIGTLLSVPLTAVAWAIIKSWGEPIVPTPGIDTPGSARDKLVEKNAKR